jgi:hypothetical protein
MPGGATGLETAERIIWRRDPHVGIRSPDHSCAISNRLRTQGRPSGCSARIARSNDHDDPRYLLHSGYAYCATDIGSTVSEEKPCG